MQIHKIDILFFERPLVDLKKFAFKIAKKLKDIDANLKIGAIALELPENKDKNDIDYFFHRSDIHNFDDFILESNVKIIVFTQTRIPDLELMLHAKRLGIKTVMIQEGVMFDGMNINDVSVANAVAILSYFPKVIEYFKILHRMCKYDDRSFIKTIWHFLKKKKNVTITLAKEFSDHLICDYVFTMGKYWDEYYINTHGYSHKQIRLIGDHDLDGYTSHKQNEPAICYIANVLVEDGTVKKKDFNIFLEAMANSIDQNTKLYIKLHPRSNQSLYNIFKNHNVEFIRSGQLPSTTIYIGHRSALLGRALYESDNLIIWRFACEEVCFYERFATATCTNALDLERALNTINIYSHSHNKLDDITQVYWNNPEGAMHCAAKLINNYLINQVI